MPTDLPFVNFLRKSATDGFTLLETMLSLAVLGILLVLAVPDFYPMLQRQRFENSASEIRALLEETQSLALTSQVSYRVGLMPTTTACSSKENILDPMQFCKKGLWKKK